MKTLVRVSYFSPLKLCFVLTKLWFKFTIYLNANAPVQGLACQNLSVFYILMQILIENVSCQWFLRRDRDGERNHWATFERSIHGCQQKTSNIKVINVKGNWKPYVCPGPCLHRASGHTLLQEVKT